MIETETLVRFNHNATTVDEADNYIRNRAKQLFRAEQAVISIIRFEWGVSAHFTKDGKTYQSLYILEQFRSLGIYKKHITHTILSSAECGITEYLQRNKIDSVIEYLEVFDEYRVVAYYYGSQKAERSGVYYMNHIDEGLAILGWIGASNIAKKAFCLHPIFQSDEALKNWNKNYNVTCDIMIPTMEYRSVANEYLSTRQITHPNQIRLSPLRDVNHMLIADKIQNRKDFELYHKDTHPRSAELVEYFNNRIKRLEISEEQYQIFKEKLS